MTYPGPTTYPGADTFPGSQGDLKPNQSAGLIWLDPTSPAVRAAVLSGAWGKFPHSDHALPLPVGDTVDTIWEALAAASDILTMRTRLQVHPPGWAVEEFTAQLAVRRLSPVISPLTSVISMSRLGDDGVSEAVPVADWVVFQNSVYFDSGRYTSLGEVYRRMGCRPGRDPDRLTLTYTFGSTITPSARRAVLYLAHQIWLESNRCDECDDCQLPDRTTFVAREGVQYTLSDSSDFLDSGRTGLPGVDSWVAGVNPRQALRRSAVFDTSAPPGVVRSVGNLLLGAAPAA